MGRRGIIGRVDESRQPAFHIREIPIWGDLILAPMDGYSDLPFRLLAREFGSAMSYTEFVNVDALSARAPNPVVQRKLCFDPRERPIAFQIYGHDEEHLVEMARRLEDQGASIIDVNMGCYIHKIAGRGAGAGLLREPAKVARLFARLTRALRVPVTAKIRLGWDDQTRNYLEIARILEENGASLIAVHARTKVQGYAGRADWDTIAEIKQAAHIPVVGNGDVRTVADIARRRAQTGCDGVMIGRGAIGNPWIFSRRDRNTVPLAEKIALMRRHLAHNVEFYGEPRGVILFRKHAYRYTQGLPCSDRLRAALMRCVTRGEFDVLIDEYANSPARSNLPAGGQPQ